jgi:hypothetical protein
VTGKLARHRRNSPDDLNLAPAHRH